MRFESLNLIEPLLRAVRDEGYTVPTPIQQQAIGPLLAGHDLLGCAQTGTGKTAAFALPILQRLEAAPKATSPGTRLRVLVLAPTRELASQICESFTSYGKHTRCTATVIFGGVGQEPQVRALRRGVDVLVATPGRLLDLMGQGLCGLQSVETLVLDEADRMLDMGFVRDVRRILAALPARKQTLLFSATMPPEVQELAEDILRNPVRVSVTPAATTVERITQSVYFVEKADKRDLLEHLLRDPAISRVLVFTRTKHGADKVVKNLESAKIDALAIHGNKSQSQRTRALDRFKSGATRVLVATDIAARGIDVDGVTHVINHDLPNEPDSYVHRIGRTARAGAEGIALSFCDTDERAFLRDIERLIRLQVPVVADHPYASRIAAPAPGQPASASRPAAPRRQRQGPPSRQVQESRPPKAQPARMPQGQPARMPQSAQAPRQPQGQAPRPPQGQPSRQQARRVDGVGRPSSERHTPGRADAASQERIVRDWW